MPGLEKHMIDQKRGTWWVTDPVKGKKGFATEKEAEAWLAGKEEPKKEEPKVEESE